MKIQYLLRALFLCLCTLIMVLALRLLGAGFTLATDLADLFPQSSQDPVVLSVNDKLYKAFGNNIVLAVEARTKESALMAMNHVTQAVSDSADIQVVENASADIKRLSQQQLLLLKYRHSLLTPDQAKALAHNDVDAIVAQGQQALLGFGAMRTPLSPARDPLALSAALIAQLQPPFNAELVDNLLVFQKDKVVVVMLLAQLKQASLKLDTQQRIKAWQQNLAQQVSRDGDAKLLVSGIVFHAAEASANASREISTIGFGSFVGVLLLFWLAFRSLTPLLLSLSSVAFGCASAVVVTHAFFGNIHLLTLVFGASLIGVAIDYALHFLCHCQWRKGQDARDSSDQKLRNILPSLSLGLLTSSLGYSCLLQAELPGLQQVAVFSMSGLVSAWLFVTVVLPLLVSKGVAPSRLPVTGITHFLWKLWFKAPAYSLWLFFLVGGAVIFAGLTHYQFSTDARTLYKPSSSLLASEKRLQHNLQAVASNQYFLLRAGTVEQLLQLEERFRNDYLNSWVEDGVIEGYSATSRWLPSIAAQEQNYSLQKERLYADGGVAEQFMISVGFPLAAVHAVKDEVAAAAEQRLSLPEWLAVAGPEQKMLWLGEVGSSADSRSKIYASLITLRAIQQLSVISQSDLISGVTWVDRVAQMSNKLGVLMQSALALLCVAYLLIAVLLLLIYRRWQALFMVFLPLASTAFVLALLSLFSVPLNLFHILASFLLLGLGMDYGIFAYTGGEGESTQRAVFLSAITSILSFGLLALSVTPMIQAFGITLLIGSSFNLLLAPLITVLGRRANEAVKH